MNINRIAACVAAIFVPAGMTQLALAQDNMWIRLAGTANVGFARSEDNGKVESCQLAFKVLAIDSSSGEKMPFDASGVISFLNAGEDGPALGIVVVASDIDPATGNMTPSAPLNANIVWDGKSTKTAFVAAPPSQRPGGYSAVFKPIPSFGMVMSGLVNNSVQLVLTRKENGPEIPVTIDPTVTGMTGTGERQHSDEAKKGFYACYTDLLNATYFKNGIPPELRLEMEKRDKGP